MKIISGPKGSGKTKKIIDLANNKLKETIGELVFINDREKYRSKLNTSIRYVNTDEFCVYTPKMMLGFLNGLIAGNYDIKCIYIDNLLRITKANEIGDLEVFLKGLEFIEEKYDVDFVLSITSESEEIPAEIKDYALI